MGRVHFVRDLGEYLLKNGGVVAFVSSFFIGDWEKILESKFKILYFVLKIKTQNIL